MPLRVERARRDEADVVAYLERDVVRNALDIWSLRRGDRRHELHVCRVAGEVEAHLSVYDSPDAKYAALGGERDAAEALLHLVPSKAVLTITPGLHELVASKLRYDKTYLHDIMVVRRGEERLKNPELATRLSSEHAVEYAEFGPKVSAPGPQLEWVRERLDTALVFGAFSDGRMVSVGSLVAWLPQVAVIMGVETKPEFRRRGFGGAVVSAAVREGLRRSQSCSLFVRSDNAEATSLYRTLGFQKSGEEFWIDIGTGLVP